MKTKIAVTGATGQLGKFVVDGLLAHAERHDLVALVRNPDKASALSAKGVEVRKADYTEPASLDKALAGIDRLLLISSSEVGRREAQHRNVIEAAKRQKVKVVVYTSLLHADSSPLALRVEHLATEKLLAQSGLHYVILRNGWYTENHAASIPAALAHGAVLGCAGDGRISSAARSDYAEAASKALLHPAKSGTIYELAGDNAYTLSDFAAELSKQSGKKVVYQNLQESEYKAVLVKAGLPEGLAGVLADSDAGAAKGGLFERGRQLSALIGHPTTTLAEVVKRAMSRSA